MSNNCRFAWPKLGTRISMLVATVGVTKADVADVTLREDRRSSLPSADWIADQIFSKLWRCQTQHVVTTANPCR